MYLFVTAYIVNGQYNVILVDWSGHSCKDYRSAYRKCQSEVPSLVADVINQMIESGYSKDLIEVVGVTLGAHCAGAMGRYHFNGSLPIIIGKSIDNISL